MDFILKNPLPFMVAVVTTLFLLLLAKSATRRFRRLSFLWGGLDIIQKAYNKAHGTSFKVSTPDNDILMITSQVLLKEVKLATHRNLSLNAAATELLQPEYTMRLFKWHDHRSTRDGGGFTRALRQTLTSHLPYFQPHLERIIGNEFQIPLGQQAPDAWAQTRIFPMVKQLVSKLNCFVFFGPELWENDEFVAAALDYPQRTVLAAELLRTLKLPKFLCRLAAGLATNWGSAETTMARFLSPIIQQRMSARAAKYGEAPDTKKQIDVVQFMVDVSPRSNWTTQQMLGQILSIWVASVHQISMVTTFALQDLCVHSEYVEPLRQEIRAILGNDACSVPSIPELDRLSLLDSFLRESIRMTNTDPIIMRRKAIEPHKFSDGSWLAKGDWVCMPQQAMMKDATRYRNPDSFNGYRFAQANELLRCGKNSPDTPDKVETKLSDASYEWSAWGMEPAVCPGRWYASLVIKLIVVHVLENWDCKLQADNESRFMTWRSNCFPRNNTLMLFRKRE